MMATLRMVQSLAPTAGIIENVQGLRGGDGKDAACALSLVKNSLASAGYAVQDLDLDLLSFHRTSRDRFSVEYERSEHPGSKANVPRRYSQKANPTAIPICFSFSLPLSSSSLCRCFIVFYRVQCDGAEALAQCNTVFTKMKEAIENLHEPFQPRELLWREGSQEHQECLQTLSLQAWLVVLEGGAASSALQIQPDTFS